MVKINNSNLNSGYDAFANDNKNKPKSSFHYNDLNYEDVLVKWVDDYTFMVYRYFSDGCIGGFVVYAPTGEACCYAWVKYKH